ncbi:MAG: hypothetical protein J7J31_08995 [Helicobacteraceae bacterium]|nr:hypothetical protein [Helicobacteraceae bacterium]
MKKLLFLLIFSISLFASQPFTLENLNNLRIYFVNKAPFLDKELEQRIKDKVTSKLQAQGIRMNRVDASTLILKIEAIKLQTNYVINTQIAIAEEVITKRKEDVGTFAYTYHLNDLFDTKEPRIDTMESFEFLLEEFLDLYKEDNEN